MSWQIKDNLKIYYSGVSWNISFSIKNKLFYFGLSTTEKEA